MTLTHGQLRGAPAKRGQGGVAVAGGLDSGRIAQQWAVGDLFDD
jgi:hypothetical protein